MPYIKQDARDRVDQYAMPLASYLQDGPPGELNYAITRIIQYILDGRVNRYATYNEMIGVLECAKLELYRRGVAPYEDTKREENGDVYRPQATERRCLGSRCSHGCDSTPQCESTNAYCCGQVRTTDQGGTR